MHINRASGGQLNDLPRNSGEVCKENAVSKECPPLMAFARVASNFCHFFTHHQYYRSQTLCGQRIMNAELVWLTHKSSSSK